MVVRQVYDIIVSSMGRTRADLVSSILCRWPVEIRGDPHRVWHGQGQTSRL
jgi:hypothetical protein